MQIMADDPVHRPTDNGKPALDRNAVGMIGVYLVAAELSHRGFIVSPTSRSARGADLLVTDQKCRKAWSVQVKTNAKVRDTWSVKAPVFNSDSHVYVFVSLKGDSRPEYKVVRSSVVATRLRGSETPSKWCYFHRSDGPTGPDEGWDLFGESGEELKFARERYTPPRATHRQAR